MEQYLTLISPNYLQEYLRTVGWSWTTIAFKLEQRKEFSLEDFEYYVVASSLYSSKIEGNTLDVNSFFRNREKKTSPKQKEVQEIEALMQAYTFAADNALNRENFFKAHFLLSANLLPAKERGCLRKDQIGVRDAISMRPVYLAVEPEYLQVEFNKLFNDIDFLLNKDLQPQEVFYFASMLHLWLAQIHPFGDGNGRSARLLEKWFVAAKLGKSAWAIHSEKYYWDHRPDYYQNIALGFNYYALHWERCMPFLCMLPKAVELS